MINALTIDLEDWYHPEFVRNHCKERKHPQITHSTKRVLTLLNKHDLKATFFVLGDIIKNHPKLLEEIYSNGHEIASHGISHLPLWELNYDKLQDEIQEFIQLIKNILGDQIRIEGLELLLFLLIILLNLL
jgi:peptidoglycan/xylan/chitin deacetylase (PgdA/CDA1 family)